MIRAFINVFRIPELRNKVLFTLAMLAVYRVGFYVPLPGVNQERLSSHWSEGSGGTGSGAEKAAELFAMFTGGDLGQSTLFGLGIMPYISASIIFQILITLVPALEKLAREGESGRRKINEYTRYGTVALCLVQSVFWINYLNSQGLVYPDYAGTFPFALMGVTGLMAGTLILMWIGEQIDEYGIGNGISLIIMAGIVAKLPNVFIDVYQGLNLSGRATGGSMDASKILFMLCSFISVVAAAVLITQAQRRIPIQQAKQLRGRRVVGGARHYLPLKINHGGVMPIIFASSFLILPNLIFQFFVARGWWPYPVWVFLYDNFQMGQFLYSLTYIVTVYVFAYFWVSVQFKPRELADNLRDSGSFIPGLRPGKRTADYLETVMERITYVGAGFLAVIAVIPEVVAVQLEIPFRVAMFLGGTGLLICVSVALDLVQRLEANLVMRNYEGFLGPEGGGRVKGRSG